MKAEGHHVQLSNGASLKLFFFIAWAVVAGNAMWFGVTALARLLTQ